MLRRFEITLELPKDMTLEQMKSYLTNCLCNENAVPSRYFDKTKVVVKSIPLPKSMFPQNQWIKILSSKKPGMYIDVLKPKTLSSIRRAAKKLNMLITTKPMVIDNQKLTRVFILMEAGSYHEK